MCIRDSIEIMKSILILLAVATLGSAQNRCPEIVCNETVAKDGLCSRWVSKKLFMNMCKKDQFCFLPLDVAKEGHCVKMNEMPRLLPGEYCDSNKQCLHGSICEKNVCKGNEKGKPCNIDENCDVELYCDSTKRCAAPTKDCSKTGKCKSNEVCLKGACVTIGQLKDGVDSTVPGACRSYYVRDKKCAEGPRLHENDRLMCPYDEQCRYNHRGKEVFSSKCICSGSLAVGAFCAPGLGDVDTSGVSLGIIIVRGLYGIR
eukprot:TRINITY_DN758_c0_g2_i2.p1 TRINITY_DN758_c0_g2~~TRINITY_DN758_c0_g2_i2.p1  ORF type:complete len:259 (-),score=40.63 TRINITY_DN758_c0_g2_i2:456-1232(-)